MINAETHYVEIKDIAKLVSYMLLTRLVKGKQQSYSEI